jgi:hypothetical protein
MPSPKYGTDPDYSPFEFRTGIAGFPSWAGISKQGSPTFPDANQLRETVNVRPVVGGLKCRGGMVKASSNFTTGDLDGIFEAGDIGA